MRKFGAGLLFLTVFAVSLVAQGEPRRLKISLDEVGEFPRQLFQKKPTGFESEVSEKLFNIKAAISVGHYKTCLLRIEKARDGASEIETWLMAEEVLCRDSQFQKERAKQAGALWSLLKNINKSKAMDRKEPAALRLKERWIDSSLRLFEWQHRKKPKEAWANFDHLEAWAKEMSEEQLFELYSTAGRLSMNRGRQKSALDFFVRSLQYQASESVQKKVARLRRRLGIPVPEEEKKRVKVEKIKSDEEEELYSRFRKSLKLKDYVAAVEDGVEFLNTFPESSRRRRVSRRVFSVYSALAKSPQERLELVKLRVLETMKNANPKTLYSWARRMSSREHFQDTLVLAEGKESALETKELGGRLVNLVGHAYLNLGDFEKSEEQFQNLVDKFSGTKAYSTALFRLGLLRYRAKDYKKSAELFAKYLDSENNEDYNVSSHYWRWRSLQGLKDSKTEAAKKALIERYPVSYFGLRARLDGPPQVLEFPTRPTAKDIKLDMGISPAEFEAWKRARLLSLASWFGEAEAELRELPEPKSAEGRIVWAALWAKNLNYPEGLGHVSEAWEEKKQLVNRSVLSLIFPKEFSALVAPQAKRYGLEEKLILALIRQESSFRYAAVSPAGALGLMQIMPPTGREVARDIRVRNFNAKRDLVIPEINIRLGTNYLHRLRRAFKGHIPLALAAYNAGIGNIRKWMRNRPDLVPDQMSTADPDSELWVEELPWLETSGYVKNILRNWIVYRYLDQSTEPIEFPVWPLSS